MPILHLIAGPNGAGKTLLYEYLIKPRHEKLVFINPQAYAQEYLMGVPDARKRAEMARTWADEARDMQLRSGQSFVLETAFSHASRVALIEQARELGYEVVLYALGIDEPRKLLPRVALTAHEGIEPVPEHKVLARYTRILDNYRRAVRMADLCFLFDVADVARGGPRLVASVASGQMRLHTMLRPRWVQLVLGFADMA
jgi:predicted ABC-type ATPase